MIETERLRLRAWTMADAEPFIRYLNNDRVMRWLGGVRTPEEQEAVVRDRFIAWQEERGFTFWAVERKEDGELLGFCGLKIADDATSPVAGEYESAGACAKTRGARDTPRKRRSPRSIMLSAPSRRSGWCRSPSRATERAGG